MKIDTISVLIQLNFLKLLLNGVKCNGFLCSVDLHPGMIFVNNQADTQLFMYVYFHSLYVAGSHVPIIRRIIVSMRLLVYVTLFR